MSARPYTLSEPRARVSSVVIASSHSGRDYPEEFLRRIDLDARAVRSSEDAFVDLLVADAPAIGAPLLAATVPRAYVDLNRAPEELDPALIEGVPRAAHNPRVASGLGVLPRVVAGGRAISSRRISRREAEARLAEVWHPYHGCLATLLGEAQRRFGEAILIDMHSMPHEAIVAATRAGERPADVVLGDRFGTSADAEVIERIEAAFAAAGLKVARNAPFAGAYTVQHYGRPAGNQHAVQVEIDRALYMNEALIRPNRRFQEIRRLIAGVLAEIIEIGQAGEALPMAAE